MPRIVLIGGPASEGVDLQVHLPSADSIAFVCWGAGEPFQHFINVGQGTYVYAGPCGFHEHRGAYPHPPDL